MGYVAATKNGVDIRNTPDYLNIHFDNSVAEKSTGFVYPPDTNDDYVYQDEFINFINTEFPGFDSEEREKIFFCLDNEPELWNSTHSAIHPAPVTPVVLTSKTIEYATAIKNVVPGAEVFSFVSYGFGGF